MKDHRFQSFTIRVGIQGFGVFALKNFKKGKILFRMRGKTYRTPTRTSVQVDKKRHMEDVIAGHLNHNCHPNAKVYRGLRSFVALRDIHAGEEITFDYNKNEDRLSEPFVCACCQRNILGKKNQRLARLQGKIRTPKVKAEVVE